MIFSGDSRIVPASGYDLESRFTKLEDEVTRLREDVASARALAALADRDVAELRQEMRAGFAMQATGMAQITALLTTIAGPEHGGS
jgi:hypothetical protein